MIKIPLKNGPNSERKKTSGLMMSRIIGYITMALMMALLLFFLVIPIGNIIVKAFYNGEAFTLQYFQLLFASSLQTESLINSLWIGCSTVIFATLLTVPLALINVCYEYPGKGLMSGLLLVPLVMPPFVGAIGFQRFFAKLGTVNLLLLDWGVITKPIDWLAEANMLWVVVILEVLHLYPILYLNISAALANVDPSMEEMAEISGAGRFRIFKDIAWPLARPGYFAGVIIVFIWAFTDLGTPLLVGFNETIPVRIFNMVTDINENPVGFALVFVVIVLTILLFLISKKMLGKHNYQMMAKGHVTKRSGQPHLGIVLGIYALIGGVVFFALIPHISVFLTSISGDWFMTPLPTSLTSEHYVAVFNQELSLIGIKNSFIFAGFSTFIDFLLGVLIAYVVTRKLIPLAGWLDSLVMIPLALPGIVLAFGYVVTYSNTFLDPMNNPVPLLIIAYAIRRLPYMVRAASAGLEQLSVSLEEASETFGASRIYTLRKITIPLVTANLIAGSLLCFSYAMLDVSDSLILAMKDRFYPITKAIYALFLEHGTGEFTASALGMIAMGILSLSIIGSSLLLGKKMGEIFRS